MCLQALSTIYGVELMADNAAVCRRRLLDMNPYEPSDEAITEMDSSEVPEELREEGKE